MLHNVVEQLNSKILLIVDSDNDGFTSSAIMYLYLKAIRPDIEIDYLLHQGKQHGLEDHIDTILNTCTHDLVIIPDAGSNDYEYIKQLVDTKFQVLVLDHHLAEEFELPGAVVVNNQLSPEYANKELSGAGVTYQFCRYYDMTYGYSQAEQFIDLAAWGITGDMCSLLSLENRYIIKKGFANVKNKFFYTLIDKQSYSICGSTSASEAELLEAVNPISVAFYIVPLVNAIIRVGTEEEKTHLFEAFIHPDNLIPSKKRGANGALERICVEVARECTNAKNKQGRMLDNITATIEAKIFKYDLLQNKILFIRLDENDDFPAELNGLVAMRLTAKYKRPTIVARLNDEGYVRGSIRWSNNGAIESFKDFLTDSQLCEYVQGHDNAAGCSIKNSNISELHQYANSRLGATTLDESYYDVNFERIAADADLYDLITEIDSYKSIWGQNTPEPYIYVKDINFNIRDVQIMGAQKDTVKITKNGIAYMKFKAKDMVEKLNEYTEIKMEIVGRANLNEWGGRVTPQIFIEDYEISNGALGF